MEVKKIATLKSGFTTKFGTPRQSGLVDAPQEIVFETEYSDENAFRGILDYSHLWLIWGFSEVDSWSPTVRPPRLGGNTRVGVFATRSPYRPNPLGLTLVKLNGIKKVDNRLVLYVSGADLIDGTPVYDIKPYLPYVEAVSSAKGGFSDLVKGDKLKVDLPNHLRDGVDESVLNTLIEVLKSDPRPSYHEDTRVYAFEYGGYHVEFCVVDNIAKVTKLRYDG